MSDSGLDALAAAAAVEAKLSEHGADQIRRHTFDETPEAPAEADTADTGAPRNELGQFTSTEETESEVVADEIVTADTDSTDPAVQAFLAKYNGNVDAAIKGAAHLTGKVGEQATEIGDMRRMVDELSRLTDTIQADRQPQQQYVDQATVDWYDQQVMENPQQALAWAQQQNNPLLVQRGLSVWKDLDPYEAAVYTNRQENQALHAQLQQQVQQQARLPLDATVNLALQNVRNRNPQFANYDDALEATLANHQFAAKALESAAASGDPQQIEGAIETLYSLAVGDTLQQIARTPATGDTVTAQDVVTPSTSETRDPAPKPTQLDRFREEFHQESERASKGVWVAE